MAMFDPYYVTDVLNDILGRRGLEVKMVPVSKPEPPPKQDEQSA